MPPVMLRLYIVIFLWLCVGVWKDIPTVNAEAPRKEGLYSSDDDVIILNKGNIKDGVYFKSNVWVIEFYNSWCGHCINFSPTWKSFATDLRGWRKVVSVGAVDCANHDNLKVCQNFTIVAYPSIMLIPPNFNGAASENMIKTIKSQVKKAMKDAVLEYITNPPFSIPQSWPSLKPVKTLDAALQNAGKEHKLVAVVFEEKHSTVGIQVILDVLDYSEIMVRTMLKEDVKKPKIVKYPSLYRIKQDSSVQHLISGTGVADSDRRRFVDELLSLTGHLDDEGRRIRVGSSHLQEASESHHHKSQNKQQQGQPVGVYMQDLESTLTYAFRQEVAISSTIQGPQLDALRHFVSVLAKYFPGRPQVMRFLQKLDDYLKNSTKLTGQTWVSAIATLQDKEASLPDQVLWVGCRGSKPRYRGYPCGLWTLFHTLTVAAYEDVGEVSAVEVPLAIRGYIEHFFGCDECSQNFLKMAVNLDKKIRNPVDAVLWLWMAHNKVNKRLHGDISEDKQHPKIQFPSAKACPKCRPKHDSDSDSVSWWKSSAVEAFLKKFYGKKNIILDLSGEDNIKVKNKDEEEMDWWQAKQHHQADLRKHRQLQKQNQDVSVLVGEGFFGKAGRFVPDPHHIPMREGLDIRYSHRAGWDLNHIDVGMYVAFYVVCAVIIVVLYYHIIVQKRSRIPCSKCMTD